MAGVATEERAPLPSYLKSVYYPRKDPDDLIGKPIRYRVPTSGEIKECIVCDYVTSRMKGSYFLVSHDDKAEEIVEEDEMEKIFKNRVE